MILLLFFLISLVSHELSAGEPGKASHKRKHQSPNSQKVEKTKRFQPSDFSAVFNRTEACLSAAIAWNSARDATAQVERLDHKQCELFDSSKALTIQARNTLNICSKLLNDLTFFRAKISALEAEISRLKNCPMQTPRA